jgi:high-affinity Fe2+/Pb2+ permease
MGMMIMTTNLEFVLFYLLSGIIVAFTLESVLRWLGNTVSGSERFYLIALWPVMLVLVVFYFIKSLFEDDDY